MQKPSDVSESVVQNLHPSSLHSVRRRTNVLFGPELTCVEHCGDGCICGGFKPRGVGIEPAVETSGVGELVAVRIQVQLLQCIQTRVVIHITCSEQSIG